jgi:hypothetical protein
MTHYDKELKTYADSGLRTAADWTSLGREVESEIKPRVDALHRGMPVSLYSRNQTRVLPRGRDQRPVPPSAAKE